jgi:hypothetical protein
VSTVYFQVAAQHPLPNGREIEPRLKCRGRSSLRGIISSAAPHEGGIIESAVPRGGGITGSNCGLIPPLLSEKRGLQQQDAALAQLHFSFLKTWQFKLDRHSTESNTTGFLHLDKRGSQRMEMLGICSQGCNKHHLPNITSPQIHIANRPGDLDLYVVHHEHEKFQSKNVEIIWEAISKRMLHAALPQVSE